jgi:5-methylthioadenosine/S-adenosylhomocysteine deaminase
MENADLVIENATIVTMNDDLTILSGHALVVKDGRIVAIEPEGAVFEHYHTQKTIDGQDQFVFPGFINTHTHLFQNSLKGLGRGKPLLEWLDSSVRKALPEMHYSEVYLAALSGCIENIRSGVTTILDYMYAHCSETGLDDAVVEAFDQCGVRGILGRVHAELSADLGCAVNETEDMFFADVDRLAHKLRGHPRIGLALGSGTVWELSGEGFRGMRRTADHYGIPITMHLDETANDDEFALQRYGISAAQLLDRNGVLGEDFIGVHLVHLTEETMELLAKRRVKVSHNPVSNMILGSGVAPVPELKAMGLTVGLGTDGAASNDSQNMLEVIKVASILHKCNHRDPALLPAAEVLRMATCEGARVIGREKDLGSLEIGKKADFFLFDPWNVACVAMADPLNSLVYSANPSAVRTVVIDGRVVMEDGVILCVDEGAVIHNLQESAYHLRQRTGLGNDINGRRIDIGPFQA